MREKLIELLSKFPCGNESELKALGSCMDRKHGMCQEIERLSYCVLQHLADHLIANGVTVTDNNVGCKTNADRIRAMSDEELEAFLINVDLDKAGSPFITEWGKWLQQPAEGETHARTPLAVGGSQRSGLAVKQQNTHGTGG